MGPYRSLCVYRVLMGPYRSFVSLLVPIGPYAFPSSPIGPKKSLQKFFSVLISSYRSKCVFMVPYGCLCVLMRSNGI